MPVFDVEPISTVRDALDGEPGTRGRSECAWNCTSLLAESARAFQGVASCIFQHGTKSSEYEDGVCVCAVDPKIAL